MAAIIETAARDILTYGDPRLRVRSAAVGSRAALDPAELAALCATLEAFRAAHHFGRAIAAPQIGLAKRLIAIDLGAGPFVVVDPEITWRSDETFELWDDCFSVPDRLVRVRRHSSISVRYRDEHYRERRWERLPAELAELLQHEIDHLEGVLMLDRAIDRKAIRPAAERAALIDTTRATRRLSLDRIARSAREIEPALRATPVIASATLSARLGCRVTLKLETQEPLRSFKGRGADFFVRERLRSGPAPRELVCASAGNFGQALAYAARARGIPLVVFAARSASALKIERMRALGADVRLEGDDFDAAKDAARRHAESTRAEFVEDGREIAISEGAGGLAVELLAGGAAVDDLVVPLGNGALLAGVARWTKAASPATSVVGVVAAGAPAMARAMATGDAVPDAPPRTIADGIAVRVPVREALEDLDGLVDRVVEVDDALLIQAMRLLHEDVGLVVEPAAAAGVAAILADPARYADRDVAIVVTGANITPEHHRRILNGETA